MSPKEKEQAAAPPSFRRGAEAAKEASKRAHFARTNFLSIQEGEAEIIRSLTDVEGWITVDQHAFVPTKKKPASSKSDNWPSAMGAVCRYDPAFEGIYTDCYICDKILPTLSPKDQKKNRPKPRVWALAVLREEVREDGELIGFRDQTREIAQTDDSGKATGETAKEKAYVVCNFAYDNFFKPLAVQASRRGGTILDRDWYITREGSGLETDYIPTNLDPIPAKNPDGEMEIFDLRKDYFMERYKDAPELGQAVAERASDDFYGRFFDTTVVAEGDDGDEDTPSEKPKPSNEVDPARLKELASRVKGYSKPEDAEANGAASEDEDAEEDVEEEKPKPKKTTTKKKGTAPSGPRDLG
jgi:hypothetical protein